MVNYDKIQLKLRRTVIFPSRGIKYQSVSRKGDKIILNLADNKSNYNNESLSRINTRFKISTVCNNILAIILLYYNIIVRAMPLTTKITR